MIPSLTNQYTGTSQTILIVLQFWYILKVFQLDDLRVLKMLNFEVAARYGLTSSHNVSNKKDI